VHFVGLYYTIIRVTMDGANKREILKECRS